MPYILSLDQGTHELPGLSFDQSAKVMASAQCEFTQHYPQPGWVEHSATEIFETQYQVCKEALKSSGVKAGEIAALGITNQRETLVVWNRATSEPIAPAIVWQCRRTASLCEEWKSADGKRRCNPGPACCSTPTSPAPSFGGFSTTSPARVRPPSGASGGGHDRFLAAVETDGRAGSRHRCDKRQPYLASQFGHRPVGPRNCWTCSRFPPQSCPAYCPPQLISGKRKNPGSGAKSRFSSMVGDQQSALFGQACWRPGQVKSTYGTGSLCCSTPGRNRKEEASAW